MMKDNGKNKGLEIFTLVLALVIIICAIIITMMNADKSKDDKTLAYTDLIKEMVENNLITERDLYTEPCCYTRSCYTP